MLFNQIESSGMQKLILNKNKIKLSISYQKVSTVYSKVLVTCPPLF